MAITGAERQEASGIQQGKASPPGYSLIEVMLAVIFLGIMATAATGVYFSGLASLDYQADCMLLDGKLRSRIAVLISTDFNSLNNGSETVTIRGNSYTINWFVDPADLNEDGINEFNAKKVTVSVSGLSEHSLTTIIVAHDSHMGKIS